MNKINAGLKQYIEQSILPLSNNNDEGHGLEHINYVIARSMGFARQLTEINYDMVYTIASFHDIAHFIDKDNHAQIAAEMVLEDQTLKQFFNHEQLIIIAEAIIDHRASLEYEPRSIYGKIISSADRDTNIDFVLMRVHSYNMEHNKDFCLDLMIDDARRELLERFSDNGYAREKMYFEDVQYDQFVRDITRLSFDREAFVQKYLEVNQL